MFSIRKTSTLAALLSLAMPISSFCAAAKVETQTRPPIVTDSFNQENKNFEALIKKVNDAFTTNLDTSSKQAFLKELKALSKFMDKALQNKAYEVLLRHDKIQTNLIKSFHQMRTECETRLRAEIQAQNRDTTVRDNLKHVIKVLKEHENNIKEGFKAFLAGQREASQTAAPSHLALGQGFREEAEAAASRINQKRPVKNPVIDPVAPQAAHFQFTKKNWGIALIGIAALIGGMTVGQTKYKMFTRLFGKMPEKVVVPQLSWWGWFFKKAIFWR